MNNGEEPQCPAGTFSSLGLKTHGKGEDIGPGLLEEG